MWAQLQLGFQPAATTEDQSKIAGIDVHAMEKTVHVTPMAYVGLVATKAIARPMWYFWRYMGWKIDPLTELLECVFDKLQAADTIRFWRPPASTA